MFIFMFFLPVFLLYYFGFGSYLDLAMSFFFINVMMISIVFFEEHSSSVNLFCFFTLLFHQLIKL